MAVIEFNGNTMPVEITNGVQGSVSSVFNTILGAQPESNGANVEKKLGDGVVGIISFMGDVNWLLMLALPKATACDIATKFCGFDIEYDSPDMGDVVGELANVLAGDIVARLASKEIKVAMSLPTIMRGHDVEPLLPRGLPSQTLFYSTEQGEFVIKLAGAKPGELFHKPGV